MRAIRLEQPGHLRQVEIDEPQAPGPGEALVRVQRIGLCGTDYSGFLGTMPLLSYPRILGHELGIEVGEGVGNVKPGDRCSVEPYLNCQTCFACRRGRVNCCEQLQVLGVHIDGGMRAKFIVPARKLHGSRLLAAEQLALVETLSIGCHAVDRGNPQLDEQVLVIGAGPIGLSVIEFAKLAGARITVIDVNPQRLAFARTKGVAHTVLVKGDDSDLEQVTAGTGGARHSVVFDATGSATSMAYAFNYASHSGKLVFVGLTRETVSFADPVLHTRELSVYGTRNSLPGDFDRIIRLIEADKIDTRPWITHRTTFADLIEAFPAYARPETGVIKAMVEV